MFSEIVLRLCNLDRPLLKSTFITPDFELLHQDDPELFFSLRPNLDMQWQGARIITSSLGLRSAEVGPKQPGEFRILSLGESTTFGAKVEGDQTYSAVLEALLQASDSERKYRVINAGVSAYSSFQSLKYLELRGLQLQPDLVLFSHEINDFLPTTFRASEVKVEVPLGESNFGLTDRQLYASRKHLLHRRLLSVSAVYRCLHHFSARRNLQRLQGTIDGADHDHVTIPGYYSEVATREGVKELELPTRVSVEERKDNLRRLAALCNDHGIRLVIMHPSYITTKRHQCELTEFCEMSGVPMFEVYDSLHRTGTRPLDYFVDNWHPSPLGHRALAEDLLKFIKAYPWPDPERVSGEEGKPR